MPRGLRVLAVVAVAAATLGAPARGGVVWEQWHHEPGAFDVVGPRADGSLIVAATGKLFTVDHAGRSTRFGTYATKAGAESYIAMAPGDAVEGAGCRFARDEVFALELQAPIGVMRVDTHGT